MNILDKERLDLINTEGFSDDDIRNDYDFSIFLQRYLSYSGKVGKDMEVDHIIRNQYVQHAKLRASAGSINPYIKIGKFFSDEKHLNKMREMFSSKNYEKFRFIAFRYNCILPFVASKTIMIKIRSEDGDAESFVNMNICSNKNESFIVFGWIEDGGTVQDYLDSIILANEYEIINRVLSYLFKNPTNTFFNKSWWDSLSEEAKYVVFSYHENEVHAFPEKEQSNESYQTFIPEFLPASRRDG